MNKEQAIKRTFREYKKYRMKGMHPDFDKWGIIEDEWQDIIVWTNKIFVKLYRSKNKKHMSRLKKSFLDMLERDSR